MNVRNESLQCSSSIGLNSSAMIEISVEFCKMCNDDRDWNALKCPFCTTLQLSHSFHLFRLIFYWFPASKKSSVNNTCNFIFF